MISCPKLKGEISYSRHLSHTSGHYGFGGIDLSSCELSVERGLVFVICDKFRHDDGAPNLNFVSQCSSLNGNFGPDGRCRDVEMPIFHPASCRDSYSTPSARMNVTIVCRCLVF